MLSSRWPRSPSHGQCSWIFCGSSRSYGRSHHPRQHEAFDCHAFKRNRQEECVQMPVKIARSTPRPSCGLPELLVASHISRLAFRDAAKSLLSTLVSESSGECRSKGFCRSSRNCGRSHHQRQHETFDSHAFKSNRQASCPRKTILGGARSYIHVPCHGHSPAYHDRFPFPTRHALFQGN